MTKTMTKSEIAKTLKPTHSPVHPEHRAPAIETLNELIINMAYVTTNVRHVQWNSMSSNWSKTFFGSAIEALEQQAEVLSSRVKALGGFIPATAKTIAQQSAITEFPAQPMNEEAYKSAILDSFSELAKLARLSLQKADNLNEPVTTYYLTETAVVIEKHLSLFEQHLSPKQ